MEERTMTKNDNKLIEEASKLDFIDWSYIDYLLLQADTPECKDRLQHIQRTLYHKEEYWAGLL